MLDGLRFHLTVYTPFRALDGLIAEAGLDLTADVSAAARRAATLTLLSDAPFIYAPGVIAAAALRASLPATAWAEFQSTWCSEPAAAAELDAACAHIAQLVPASKPDDAVVAPLLQKLEALQALVGTGPKREEF